jgi:hypothetical protein
LITTGLHYRRRRCRVVFNSAQSRGVFTGEMANASSELIDHLSS